jgi:DNA-binding CsgD family transcriptional regulator
MLALRGLLLLAPLLVEQDQPERILHLVAAAVPTLTSCRTDGIMFGSQWHEPAPGSSKARAALQERLTALDPLEGGRLAGPDVGFRCAYALASGRRASGYLVVSADVVPDENDQFVLRCLAHHAGVALAPARALVARLDAGAVGWERLTDTEARVAELVAQGLTNRQVAAKVFMSRHTVDTHLRHIFRKLAIASRVQLAGLVAQRSMA